MGSKTRREPVAGCKNDQGGQGQGRAGREESNLGSMEHRVCHKIIVFYTV